MSTTTKPAWMNGCECPSCDIAREMLEALEEMLAKGGTTRGEWVPSETFIKAKAAIRKAKGEL